MPNSPNQELEAVCQRKVDFASLQLASNDAAQLHSSLIAILWSNADDDAKRFVCEYLQEHLFSSGKGQ